MIERSRRSFFIKIANRHPVTVLKCLFHELVHVAQVASGRMKDIDHKELTIWGERKYRWNDNTTPAEHRKFPWEAEAYRLQDELYNKWKNNA